MRRLFVVGLFVVTVCAQAYLGKPFYLPWNQASIVNVKESPYFAAGDGITDDTTAIQNAIDAVGDSNGLGDYGRPRLIYFPRGTYLISDTLEVAMNAYKANASTTVSLTCCTSLRGEGANLTIIKLKNNSPGFNATNPDSSSYKAAIKTKGGNDSFRENIRDLTILIGSGNPGAVALDYISNNQGWLYNVDIRAESQSYVGLYMVRYGAGPCLIKRVTITGFDYGIMVSNAEYGPTFEYVHILRSKVTGFSNTNNRIALRKAVINTVGEGIRNTGLFLLLESSVTTTSANFSIVNTGVLYTRNVQVSAPISSAQSPNKSPSVSYISEWYSHLGYSLFNATLPSDRMMLQLPIEETPTDGTSLWESTDPNQWQYALEFKTNPSSAQFPFQRAIDNAVNKSRPIVFLPRGTHVYNNDLYIPAQICALKGYETHLNDQVWSSGTPTIVIHVDDGDETTCPLVIDGIRFFQNATIIHNSKRTLALVNGAGPRYVATSRAGNLFLEDWLPRALPLRIQSQQKLWCRQCNPETISNPGPKFENIGGDMWVFGIKTEGRGPVINTTSGGRSELYGTLIYPLGIKNPRPEDATESPFVATEASFTGIWGYSNYAGMYNFLLEHTLEGVTKSLNRTAVSFSNLMVQAYHTTWRTPSYTSSTSANGVTSTTDGQDVSGSYGMHFSVLFIMSVCVALL